MADFDAAFRATMEHEGWSAVSDHPHDTGGLTKWGISQSAYPDVDIEALTEEDARSIYRHDYWSEVRGEAIDSQRVATKLFDMAVNMGPRTATELAQRSCNYYGADIAEDGWVGPNTLRALNGIDDDDLWRALAVQQGAHYMRLVEIRPQNTTFARGWMRRAFR